MKILISILFLLAANLSFAADMRYYDVEIVIIENLDEKQKASENWPLQVNLTLPEKIVTLGQPVNKDWLPQDVDLKSSYKVLNSNRYQLNPEVEKITNSKSQRVIFHTAWRQPGLDKKTALPIYFKREIPAAPKIDDENIIENSLQSEDITELEPSPLILEGIFRVTLARYLHLEAELTLQNKIPEIVPSDNPFKALDNEILRNELEKQGVIHLKQKRRRMRSNELHYIDHPVLGILIKIMPYEKPEDAP